jgi:2-hydroxychromene-2-carboxylate isomerase
LLPHQPVFYYDLGSPWCYLAAEQVMTALPMAPEWEPVLGSCFGPADADRSVVERMANERGLQPFRWPPEAVTDTRLAMLAATYAKRVGRAVAFSLAAFRQVFAGGRDLALESTVVIAAAACEIHPAALLKAVELRSVAEGLESANRRAAEAGVISLPAIQLGDRTFQGDDVLEQAVGAMA